jgi:hypothetical protein
LHPNLGGPAGAAAAAAADASQSATPETVLVVTSQPAPAATAGENSSGRSIAVKQVSGYVVPTEAGMDKQGGRAAHLGGGARLQTHVNELTGSIEGLSAAYLTAAPFNLPKEAGVSFILNTRWHLTIGHQADGAAAGAAGKVAAGSIVTSAESLVSGCLIKYLCSATCTL